MKGLAAGVGILFLALVVFASEKVPYLPFDQDPFRIPYETADDYDIVYLLDSAREAVRERDWPRVAYIFGEFKRLDVESPVYVYAMAQLAFWQQLWSEALQYVETLPADYEQGEANILRGAALLQLRRPEEALTVLQDHLKQYPSSILTRRWLAETLVALHRYEDAAGMFNEILAMNPAALDNDVELKRALQELGEKGPVSRAHILKEFTQARIMDSFLPPLQAATISFLLGNQDRAVELLEEAVRTEPGSPELYHRLALFYDSMGRKQEADVHLDKAEKLDPDNPEIINNRGALAMYLGNEKIAFDSFCRALELQPAYPEALRNLCRLHFHRKEWTDVIYTARESLVVEPDSSTARLMAAFGSYKLGYYEDALRFLEPLLEPGSDLPSAWFMAGSSAQLLGRMHEAERYYRAGLRLKGDYVLGLNNLADILLKNPDSDADALREALSLAEKASAFSRRGNPAVEETLRQARERVGSLPPDPRIETGFMLPDADQIYSE
jgi:tetratricopeptide (TPR) repeat protein